MRRHSVIKQPTAPRKARLGTRPTIDATVCRPFITKHRHIRFQNRNGVKTRQEKIPTYLTSFPIRLAPMPASQHPKCSKPVLSPQVDLNIACRGQHKQCYLVPRTASNFSALPLPCGYPGHKSKCVSDHFTVKGALIFPRLEREKGAANCSTLSGDQRM